MSGKFPIPPGVVGKILRTAADPEADLGELSRLLESDAVLSVQVLKAVNSATFGLRNKIAAVDRAVLLMGVRAVRNLVLSLCVRNLVPARDLAGFPLEEFWRSSLRRGAAARCIAERLRLPNLEEFFTIGLCQDTGLLIRLADEPKLVEQLKAAQHEPSERRLQIELASGRGHDQIGFEMFSEWSFPEELLEPVRYHHHPEQAPKPYRVSARVARAAETLADLSVVDDPGAAVAAASEQLQTLGLDRHEVGPIVGRVNEIVRDFATLLGLDVGDQPTYEQIVAVASTGLAELNSSYEELNRTLEEALAEQVRMSAELETLNRELDHEARTDRLTGLANRRAFGEILLREMSVARRQNTPLSLVLFDIDDFKKINDVQGHPAGDRVLEEIGRVLKGVIRLSDSAARYGGDEFAVILPFTAEPGARALAERIRTAIEATVLLWRGQELRFTASLGGATIEQALQVDDETSAQLVQRADDALYESKKAGNNRTGWSSTTPETPPRLQLEPS